VVSYFEWVQDLQCFFWDEDEVNRNLKRIMVRAFEEVWAFCEAKQVPCVWARTCWRWNRVAEALQARRDIPVKSGSGSTTETRRTQRARLSVSFFSAVRGWGVIARGYSPESLPLWGQSPPWPWRGFIASL